MIPLAGFCVFVALLYIDARCQRRALTRNER